MDQVIDRQTTVLLAWRLNLSNQPVVQRELSMKAKLPVYWSIYVPTITYAHMTFDLLLMHGMQTSFTTICERMGFSQELSEFLCGSVIGCRMCTDQL